MDRKALGIFCLFVFIVFGLNVLAAMGIHDVVHGTIATESIWAVNLCSAFAVVFYALKQGVHVKFLAITLSVIGFAIMADQWIVWRHFWDIPQVVHHEYVASILWSFALGIFVGIVGMKKTEKK